MAITDSLNNSDVSLRDLTLNLQKGIYRIPSFQRGVVWRVPDIRELGDSLLWGFPVSSLLLMARTDSLRLADTPVALELRQLPDVEKAWYVLDGQQRLTAIANLFLDDVSSTSYYFDLLAILEQALTMGGLPRFPEEDARDLFPDGLAVYAQQFRGLIRLDASQSCASFRVTSSGDHPETKSHHRFVRCDQVLHSLFGSHVFKFLNYYFRSNISVMEKRLEPVRDIFMDYLNGLFGKLGTYGVPVTYIGEDSSLELVCRVFERINSTGMRLTTLDLVNAKTFGYDQHSQGISDYLKKQFQDAESKYTLALSYFFEKTRTGDYKDLARLLRILEMAKLLGNGNLPAITNGGMLQEDRSFWFTSFEHHKQALYSFIHWAESSGFVSVVPKALVEALAAVAISVPGVGDIQEFRSTVMQYGLHLSILGSRSFNKSDTVVVRQFHHYAKTLMATPALLRAGVPSPEKPAVRPITTETILNCRYAVKSTQYAALLHFMYGIRPDGRFNQDIFGYHVEFEKRYLTETDQFTPGRHRKEEHHLIPKASLGGLVVEHIDSIANIVVIEKDKNLGISNQRFEQYAKTYLETLPSNDERQRALCAMENNLIPKTFLHRVVSGESFGAMDYDQFLKERAEALAEMVNRFFQVQSGSASGSEQDVVLEDLMD